MPTAGRRKNRPFWTDEPEARHAPWGEPGSAALLSLTLNVAQAFRLDKELGSVAKGKFANLVLWSGEPIEFSTKVKGVMVRGQIIELRSRQTMLRERYRNL